VKSGLLLDVVVWKSAAVFELLTSKDETLLVWWDTFLVLDFSLDVLNGVGWLNVQSDGLSSESLDEDLHTSTKSEDQVKSGLLLDVVIWKSAAVFELLTSKDKALLVWWDAFLVLNLGLDVLNGVGWLDIKSDSLTSKSLDEDLHTSTKSEDQVKSGLLLDVVVR